MFFDDYASVALVAIVLGLCAFAGVARHSRVECGFVCCAVTSGLALAGFSAVVCLDFASSCGQDGWCFVMLALVVLLFYAACAWHVHRDGCDPFALVFVAASLMVFDLTLGVAGIRSCLVDGSTACVKLGVWHFAWVAVASVAALAVFRHRFDEYCADFVAHLATDSVICVLISDIAALLALRVGDVAKYAGAVAAQGSLTESVGAVGLAAALALAVPGQKSAKPAAGDMRLAFFACLVFLAHTLISGHVPTAALGVVACTVAMFGCTGRKRWLAAGAAAVFVAAVGVLLASPLLRARVAAWLVPALDPFGLGWERTYNLLSLQTGGMLGQGAEVFTCAPYVDKSDALALVAQCYGVAGLAAVVALCLLMAHVALTCFVVRCASVRRRCLCICLLAVLGARTLVPLLEFCGLCPPMSVCMAFAGDSFPGVFDFFLLTVLLGAHNGCFGLPASLPVKVELPAGSSEDVEDAPC